MENFTIWSQDTFSLLPFVVNNKDKFINSEIYRIHTRQSINLHLPQTNLAIHQKGVSSLDIKTFNSLPSETKNFSNNQKEFKTALQNFYIKILFIYYMNTFTFKKEQM